MSVAATMSRPLTAAIPAARANVGLRARSGCRSVVTASYYARPMRVRPVSGTGAGYGTWAERCREGSATSGGCSEEDMTKAWGGWGSVFREMEQGATGLLDPSPFTRYRGAAGSRAPTRPLPFDVFEEPGQVVLQFDLPGVARSDVKLAVSPEAVMTITVDRQAPRSSPPPAAGADASAASPDAAANSDGAASAEGPTAEGIGFAKPAEPAAEAPAEPERTVVRLERPYGRFVRNISLPKGVNADGIAAKLRDGVLTLTIPRTGEEQPAAVSINVE